MADHFTNLDALWLRQLADHLDAHGQGLVEDTGINRLRLIAQHLQSMDEKLAVLQGNRTYDQGWADAHRTILGRSNIVANNPEGEDAIGAAIIKQINTLEAQGRIKRVPLGERALEDQPHKFNAPLRRKPAPAKPTPAVDLDLSFLGDL